MADEVEEAAIEIISHLLHAHCSGESVDRKLLRETISRVHSENLVLSLACIAVSEVVGSAAVCEVDPQNLWRSILLARVTA
jgi:hypothetical protein